MDSLDVVYYVRPGERNEELRYSLRSLANLPHERVWVIGHKPSWVAGVEYVRGNGGHSPQHNAVHNLLLACDAVEDERFLVFNDDFYLMEPVTEVPLWHAGPLSQAARSGSLRLALARLLALGFTDPIAWSLHIPLPVQRAKLAAILATLTGRSVPEWRSMYGNISGDRGERAADVKVRRRSDPVPSGPFLSSSDATFPVLARLLAARFPHPSPYEVTA